MSYPSKDTVIVWRKINGLILLGIGVWMLYQCFLHVADESVSHRSGQAYIKFLFACGCSYAGAQILLDKMSIKFYEWIKTQPERWQYLWGPPAFGFTILVVNLLFWAYLNFGWLKFVFETWWLFFSIFGCVFFLSLFLYQTAIGMKELEAKHSDSEFERIKNIGSTDSVEEIVEAMKRLDNKRPD